MKRKGHSLSFSSATHLDLAGCQHKQPVQHFRQLEISLPRVCSRTASSMLISTSMSPLQRGLQHPRLRLSVIHLRIHPASLECPTRISAYMNMPLVRRGCSLTAPCWQQDSWDREHEERKTSPCLNSVQLPASSCSHEGSLIFVGLPVCRTGSLRLQLLALGLLR